MNVRVREKLQTYNYCLQVSFKLQGCIKIDENVKTMLLPINIYEYIYIGLWALVKIKH